MGGGSSVDSGPKRKASIGSSLSVKIGKTMKWKVFNSNDDVRLKYEEDGTLKKNADAGQLELRVLLDDAIAQRAIGLHSKELQSFDIFMCWVDIQEFKHIPTADYRRSKGNHIYHKYIKPGAVLQIGGLPDAQVRLYKEKLAESQTNPELMNKHFYDSCQQLCFAEIYKNVFVPFRASEAYKKLVNELKTSYNNVELKHFEFHEKLGEGGFSLVVHCRKKSTGRHYAMKVQAKVDLLDFFHRDPKKVDFERQAYAACQHPFIITMHYAFHTDDLTFLVMDLSTHGDLFAALTKEPLRRLNEDRVVFYAAEMVAALGYLHQMGLIYRDLKPGNVLLNADGHIQLIDLGGVLDVEGRILGKGQETAALSIMTTMSTAKDAEKKSESKPRAYSTVLKGTIKSIAGTLGYMAPEMVIMINQNEKDMHGYNYAVDWWSLGATIFRLLTGDMPFAEENMCTFVDMIPTINGRSSIDVFPEYAILFQEIPFPDGDFALSDEACDIVQKLLDVNDQTRLGSGKDGLANIKKHPFFQHIDWSLLEQKHLEPPFIPIPKAEGDHKYSTFESMIASLDRKEMLGRKIDPKDQKYFENWRFTSPQTMRVEYGIANEMAQYDNNFKVRKMLGDDKPDPSAKRQTSTSFGTSKFTA